MITSSPNHNIFKNIPLKHNLQPVPYYPYKTQNFRLKEIKKSQFVSRKRVDEQSYTQVVVPQRQEKLVNVDKQTIPSPIIPQKKPQPLSSGILYKNQNKYENKATSLLKSYLKQQNHPSARNFINQQDQQRSSSRQKDTLFRKTFCTSFNNRNHNKNLSLQLKSLQKRPPTSQIQTYKPSARIRKISNIGEQSNQNFLAKYQIIKQLGKGTYGTVYLAKIIKKDKNPLNLNQTLFNKTIHTPWINKDKIKQMEQRINQNKSQMIFKSDFFQANIDNKNLPQDETKQQKNAQNKNKEAQIQIQNASTIQICQVDGFTLKNDQKQENLKQSVNDKNQIVNKDKQDKLVENNGLQYAKSIQEQQQEKHELKVHPLIQSTDQLVAIKVYQKFKMNKDPSKFKNIRKQITIMQNLSHTGVIKLYESVQSITKISLVVQYGGQSSLLDYLRKNFPLDKNKLKNFSKQLLQIVVYLHDKNIVHRDIKPQNILIKEKKQENGEIFQELKLIDYGFSTLTNKSRKLNAICGTPNFMAPQLLSQKEYFGQKADVWSYGVVVFVMAQGRHPFKSNQYQQLQRLVNKGKFSFKRKHQQSFQQFINQILKVNSTQRPTASQITKFKWLNQQ